MNFRALFLFWRVFLILTPELGDQTSEKSRKFWIFERFLFWRVFLNLDSGAGGTHFTNITQEKEPLICPPPTQGPPPTVKRLGLFSLLGISIVLTMVCLKNENKYSDIYLTKEQAGKSCFETEHFLIEIENNLYVWI